MNQISDLKQWLDSQTVKSDRSLSPHHSEESDFSNSPSAVDRPFVPSPKFKPDQYLWFEDGKNDHPEMNIVAGQLSDYEKAKALWYKNAWESVQPVNTEMDNSNTFKKANMRKIAVYRTCPQCYSADDLVTEERVTVFQGLYVENENDIRWQDSEQSDDYEFIAAHCNKCGWSSTNPNWTSELAYDNRKNAKLIKTAIARTCPQCHRSDSLVEVNKVDVWGYVSVDNQDVEWSDSEYGDNYEFVAAECSMCNWQTTSPNWVDELGYDNRKNVAKTAALVSVDWDDDGEAVPSLVEVPFEVLQTELDGGGQVADWLTENYGWMVNGWDFVDHPDDIGEDQSPLWHEGSHDQAA